MTKLTAVPLKVNGFSPNSLEMLQMIISFKLNLKKYMSLTKFLSHRPSK